MVGVVGVVGGIGLTFGRGGGGGAATPAPFQSVNADGWSTTYSSPVVASPEPFTVVRAGYVGATASDITETMYATTRIRQPYPNQASMTTDQVALSDYIYSTDTVTGATNNSAETSPKPVANWAETERRVIGDTLVAEVLAYHRNARGLEQVAAVEFSATDGSTTVTQVVTSSVVSGRSGDQLPVIVYKCSLDVSSLADPATITLNAKVYPHIGGAASVLDSADQTGRREFAPRFYRRDTTLSAAPVLAYVDAGGNDTTGAVSSNVATASASPCATISGAISRLVAVNGRVDGCEIRCTAGTHVLSSGSIVSTRTQDYARLTITRDPLEDVGDVTITMGSAATRLRLGAAGGWLSIKGVTFQRTGVTQPGGESASQAEWWYEDCLFDNNSQNSAPFGNNLDGGFLSCTFSNLSTTTLNAGAQEIRIIRGCTGTPASVVEGWLAVGNLFTNPGSNFGTGSRTESGSIIGFNRITGASASTSAIALAASTAVTGAAIVQNVIEYTSATTAPSIRVSSDNAPAGTTHVLIHHNTFAGFFINGRGNLFYDDGVTARTNKLMSCRGNIHVQINTKGDIFETDGARLGNRAYVYGVGCEGEFSQFIDASEGGIGSAFAQAYPGMNASIGTSATVANDPLFVNPEATTSGPTLGAGGGDYALQSGSPAKAMASAVLRFDAAGTERTTETSAGAYV